MQINGCQPSLTLPQHAKAVARFQRRRRGEGSNGVIQWTGASPFRHAFGRDITGSLDVALHERIPTDAIEDETEARR